MQCENDLNKISEVFQINNIQIPAVITSAKKDSVNGFNTQNESYNSARFDATEMSLFRNSQKTSTVNSPKMNKGSLHDATIRFLNELASSSPAKPCVNNENGFALSSINSPFSLKESNGNDAYNLKGKISSNDSVIEESNFVSASNNDGLSIPVVNDNYINVCDKQDCFVLNSPVLAVSNECVSDISIPVSNAKHVSSPITENMSVLKDMVTITDNKDVANVLNLIEQSTLQDPNLSSAEICNSLNQIFSEDANMTSSADIVSATECIQVQESSVNLETITVEISGETNTLSDTECHQIQETDVDLETIIVQISEDAECHQTQETDIIQISEDTNVFLSANTVSGIECSQTQEIVGNLETITLQSSKEVNVPLSRTVSGTECHQIENDVDLETITVQISEDANTNAVSDAESHHTKETGVDLETIIVQISEDENNSNNTADVSVTEYSEKQETDSNFETVTLQVSEDASMSLWASAVSDTECIQTQEVEANLETIALQISEDTNMPLSASTVLGTESSQTQETDVSYETVTVQMSEDTIVPLSESTVSDSECGQLQNTDHSLETITVQVSEDANVSLSENAISYIESHQIEETQVNFETITVQTSEDTESSQLQNTEEGSLGAITVQISEDSNANKSLPANAISHIESSQTQATEANVETITMQTSEDTSQLQNTDGSLETNTILYTESSQTQETDVNLETVTFQTVESATGHSINFNGRTINLADLGLPDNPELWKQILLVQDESGNIETVLLLPEDAQLVENISSEEPYSTDSVQLLGNNVEDGQTNQCVIVNDIHVDDVTNTVQNILTSPTIPNNSEHNLILQNSVIAHPNSEINKNKIENSVLEVFAPELQNLAADHLSKVEKNSNDSTGNFPFHDETVANERNLNAVNIPSTLAVSESSSDKTNMFSSKEVSTSSEIEGHLQQPQNFVTDSCLLKVVQTEKSCRDSTSNLSSVQLPSNSEKRANKEKELDAVHITSTLAVNEKSSDKSETICSKQMSNISENKHSLVTSAQDSVANTINAQYIDKMAANLTSKEGSNCVEKHNFLPRHDTQERPFVLKRSSDVLLGVPEHTIERRLLSNIITEGYNNSKVNEKTNNINLNSDSAIPDCIALRNNQPLSKAKKRCSGGAFTNESSLVFNQRNDQFHTIINSNTYNSSIATHNSESEYIILVKDQSNNLPNFRHSAEMEELDTPVQKSKKSFPHKMANRSAKKSFSNLKMNGSSLNINEAQQVYNLSNSSGLDTLRKILKSDKDFVRLKNILKRGIDDSEIIQELLSKRPKSNSSTSIFNDGKIEQNRNFQPKSRTVALKTFVKPFTAAKKSFFDPREVPKIKLNTALKTCVPKTIIKQTALKSFSHKQVPEVQRSIGRNVSAIDSDRNVNPLKIQQSNRESSTSYFQPEVCEIKILPKEYVERASNLLLKGNSVECASNPEENASEDEIKLPSECSSPLKELLQLKFHCTCSAKEVPCLCFDKNLQVTCEAEDTVDEKIVHCTSQVSQQYLLTPSTEIKHRAFCDIHLRRLREHHCCPKCGVFCSQGDFLLCSYEAMDRKENHLFHPGCFIVPSPGLPPGCPHCCKFSNFTPVKLICRSTPNEKQEVPSNAQNITSNINNCDVFLTVKDDDVSGQSVSSDVYVPQKKAVQLMISSLAKEDILRLRPTGKCLYNPIKTGDVQKVMQLLGNGVNPNHKFRVHRNNSPLHVAAYYGWTGILHILIQAGAFIDTINDDLETPLIVAVEKNQLPIVRYLVLAGAQIDVKDCNGMSSFHIAAKNGFREIADYLYNTGRIDINLQDDGGWTALVWSCEHKHVGFVQWLLEIGADPNVRDSEENTVLHWAAYSGKCEIAELLLEKGCTLSYVNKRGDSALHIAAREDNYECVKLFINRGAVLDQKNKENKTPLMCCGADSLSFKYVLQSISSGSIKIGKLQLEKHVVFRDISRGAETYPIQAVNEIDEEEFIMEFRYVVKQCHRSGLNIISTVDSMQFCYCKDNCVRRDCNCTRNSKCWYDANGCLYSEDDLETSPIIFECNKTCHCPKTCMNRVVQHGMKFPLQIFRTQYQGWGVRALQDIPKGAFVCEYVGEVITGTEATQRSDDTYLFDLESQGSDYCLDGRYYGNVARFLNHSCEPNLIALKVFIDHQDMNFPRIAFFALKEISAFDELRFDYGLDFWIVKCQTILCTCNTQSCKYSKDTIDETLLRFFMDTNDGPQMECES